MSRVRVTLFCVMFHSTKPKIILPRQTSLKRVHILGGTLFRCSCSFSSNVLQTCTFWPFAFYRYVPVYMFLCFVGLFFSLFSILLFSPIGFFLNNILVFLTAPVLFSFLHNIQHTTPLVVFDLFIYLLLFLSLHTLTLAGLSSMDDYKRSANHVTSSDVYSWRCCH